MGRLLIVSNRLPIKVSKEKGELKVTRSVGGLATGIGSVHKSLESLWVGWPGYNVQKQQSPEHALVLELMHKEKCHPVFLSPQEIKQYYGGFCNNTLWPLFHYFNLYAKYDPNHWNSYKRVNQKFCDAIMEIAQPEDTIWIQDYHLMLLPKMIREQLPTAKIGFFLHTPFPSYEVFRLLPWRKELLTGLIGADLVGFHTFDYARHFLSSVRRILGYEHSLSEVNTGSRLVHVEIFPMGIDFQRFSQAISHPKVQKEIARLKRKITNQQVILSYDRLDYTKGIPLRLEAFDVFLTKKPQYRGKVTLLLVAVSSRDNVKQYQMLKKQIDELVGRINGKFGTTDWLPVRYFNHVLPFEMLVAFYSVADVGLVTPLRDGMNLMAKEFIATKKDGKGMLVLSEMTGAAQELGEALIVNPNNQAEIIRSVEEALLMPVEEQETRNSIMQKRLRRYDINRWVDEFLNRLDEAWRSQEKNTQHVITPIIQQELIGNCKAGKKRLILLDYDGTLVPFANKPEQAIPTPEVVELLKQLAAPEENEVVIISGRDHKTLTKWFGALDVSIIAEHGAWIKESSGETRTLGPLSEEWKKEILPLLEIYTDRTPGSLIEEKKYSLVWHYRKTDPLLGSLRANTLKDDLVYLTSNLGLSVVEGKKVVEVKSAMINKGRAAQIWFSRQPWDFIIALGDDKTDEDLFEVLPPKAYSIKVGLEPSKARYNLLSQRDVLPLLKNCLKP